MKKQFLSLFLMAAAIMPMQAIQKEEVKPVKNVIVMIPDGTSLATVSIARWLQWYQDPSKPKLNIDPYLCGTVRTHSSNAPIGDSAPTTSCYMTGQPSRTGYVSTYPEQDKDNDIYPTEAERAFQPLTTVLEAGKILQGKATGLVFTCEFPHATPADCSAHSYKRGRYDWIAPQMVHNELDVVIGGGVSILTEEMEKELVANGYNVYRNDLQGMRADKGEKMWALYGDKEMAYDLDRDPNQQPSIEEMTRKAIEKLSKDPDGFFLMVEGSKVDWAAHGNDPVGMATDFLAFDRACGAALEFARKNGETAVVILPDHGNSGISLGRRSCKGYDKLSKDQLFHQFSLYKLTAEGFAKKVNSIPNSEVQQMFSQYAGFELTDEEMNALNNCKDYKNSPIPAEQRKTDDNSSMYSGNLTGLMAHIITSRTCFGFTTGGHTGEEVFLAAYHPQGSLPIGMNTNIEINEYLCNLFGLTHDSLETLTAENFVPHTQVFEGYDCQIVPAADEKGSPSLVVKNKKNKKKQLSIAPFTNVVKVGKKAQEEVRLHSVVVYVDKNNTFYVPKQLADLLK